MTTIDINNALAERRILDIATLAGWHPHTITVDGAQHPGWAYPVFRTDGAKHDRLRWKSANGSGPKYWWPKGKPEQARYYFMPGIKSAIERANGLCYFAGGEPDVLALNAAGFHNSLCWLSSEIAVPKTLVEDMRYLGVELVIYAPDRDVAGMRSAYNVWMMLKDSGIETLFLELPGEMGSKKDINDLWIACDADAVVFEKRLYQNEIDLIDIQLYGRAPGGKVETEQQVAGQVNDWHRAWIETIRGALGPPAQTSDGKERWCCPLPGHQDNHPSFRISTDQKPDHPWPVCSCDVQYHDRPWDEVAAAVGVPTWADYKRDQAQREGITVAQPAASSVKRTPDGDVKTPAPLFVSSPRVYRDIADELEGEKEPEGDPIAFPYETLHRFGGFAEYLWTGKTVGVGGISGGGKTMLLKCIMSVLLRAGHDVIWWGPEWSPQEYGLQDLQRAGGLDFRQINALRVARKLAIKQGKTIEQVMAETGKAVPGAKAIAESVKLLREMEKHAGQMHYITDMSMTVQNVMEASANMAHTLRSEGRQVSAFVFDYAQLANMPGRQDWAWGIQVLNAIKAGVAVSEADLVGFVGIQSRKDDAEKVRKEGARLTMDAGQGTKEDPFNLYLTLTPAYGETGGKLPHGLVSVEKNSTGETGSVRLHINWSRLMVYDREAHVETGNHENKGID